jgi:hypothetical protein
MELAEIVELRDTGQILNLESPIANSYIVKSIVNVVDGELMDESKTHLLASIGIFCLFIESISNEKKHRKNINELMLHFDNNALPKLVSKNQYRVLQTTWLFLEVTQLAHKVEMWNPFSHFTLCNFFSLIPFKSLLECRKLVHYNKRCSYTPNDFIIF